MAKGYHHVTQDIRCQIYTLKSIGFSQRQIAKEVGYSESTISREIQRNSGGRGYRYKQANRLAIERRSIASGKPKKLTAARLAAIEQLLREDWSPEQISGRFRAEGILISHERIYQHVWKDKRQGGSLYKHLRHQGKKYNKRRSGKAGRGCIPNRVDISEALSAQVEAKARIGDWEGDTIIGAQHQGAIVSYVERHSKLTRLKLVKKKTAELVTQATIEIMRDLSLLHPIYTVTYDNGKEFSNHAAIAEALGTQCYFAQPYHSWERGLNEHTNGLVRQYLPKSTDFRKITDEQVQAIEDKLNNRPRKSLGYRTPAEVFYGTQPNVIATV